jgi:hypothetical protein
MQPEAQKLQGKMPNVPRKKFFYRQLCHVYFDSEEFAMPESGMDHVCLQKDGGWLQMSWSY